MGEKKERREEREQFFCPQKKSKNRNEKYFDELKNALSPKPSPKFSTPRQKVEVQKKYIFMFNGMSGGKWGNFRRALLRFP